MPPLPRFLVVRSDKCTWDSSANDFVVMTHFRLVQTWRRVDGLQHGGLRKFDAILQIHGIVGKSSDLPKPSHIVIAMDWQLLSEVVQIHRVNQRLFMLDGRTRSRSS